MNNTGNNPDGLFHTVGVLYSGENLLRFHF